VWLRDRLWITIPNCEDPSYLCWDIVIFVILAISDFQKFHILTAGQYTMTKSQKPLHRAALYAIAIYAVVVCLFVTSECVSKRLNGSGWFRYGSFLPLCCKEVRVSPKNKGISLCYFVPNFMLDLKNFTRVSQSCCQQSSLTVELVDHTYDGRRVARRTQLTARRRPQCSNCITLIWCGFVVDLVPTVVQQLTRFCLI